MGRRSQPKPEENKESVEAPVEYQEEFVPEIEPAVEEEQSRKGTERHRGPHTQGIFATAPGGLAGHTRCAKSGAFIINNPPNDNIVNAQLEEMRALNQEMEKKLQEMKELKAQMENQK